MGSQRQPTGLLEFVSALLLAAAVACCGAWLAYRAHLDQQLREAIFREDAPRIRNLIARGADVQIRIPRSRHGHHGWNARSVLQVAARRNDLALARAALDRGAPIHGPDEAAIFDTACAYGRWQLVLLLLSRGAQPIHMPDGAGINELMLAVMNERPAVVRAMLAAGADVRLKDRLGHSALFYARDQPEIEQMLREAGAGGHYNSSVTATTAPRFRAAKR